MPGRRAAFAAFVVLQLAAAATTAGGQDTAATIRHLLPMDLARVQPFRRTYDMVVLSGDSSMHIGTREISLRAAVFAESSSGWLLTESRTGLVPAMDSVFLAPDLRPVEWTSTLGASRANLRFRNDSALGLARSPAGSVAMTLAIPPDLIVSGAMLELIAATLPLSGGWRDSVSVFSADLGGADVIAGELLVVGEERVPADSSAPRSYWLLGLRADARQLLLWIDKETGAVTKTQQTLPPHAGTLLEFRERRALDGRLPP